MKLDRLTARTADLDLNSRLWHSYIKLLFFYY